MVFRRQTIFVKCPFCDKEIEVFYSPEVVRVEYSHTATFGNTRRVVREKEKYEVLADCPHCHKSKKDIKKALGGDIPTKTKSKEEVKKQLEELGLLDRFGGKEEK